jgi:hypothetical protein
MTLAATEPISRDWTTPDLRTASATDLATVLALVDPAALAPWHGRLAQAVDELHRSTSSTLAWDERDPIVALVRAVARLARTSPGASSATAASLASDLAAAR